MDASPAAANHSPRADLVEYLILAMPTVGSLSAVVQPLTDLVAARLLRILDLVVVARDLDGAVDVLELESVASIADLCDVDGDVGGLLSNRDVEIASLAVRPGKAALLLVLEDCWARPIAEAADEVGGGIVAGERIPAARVNEVLADQVAGD